MSARVTPLVAERRKRVLALRADGLTTAQMAAVLGVHRSTIKRDTHAVGAPVPNRRVLPPEVWERVEELLDDGCSATEAGRTVGVTATAVLARFPGRGWTPQQSNEHRRSLYGNRWTAS